VIHVEEDKFEQAGMRLDIDESNTLNDRETIFYWWMSKFTERCFEIGQLVRGVLKCQDFMMIRDKEIRH